MICQELLAFIPAASWLAEIIDPEGSVLSVELEDPGVDPEDSGVTEEGLTDCAGPAGLDVEGAFVPQPDKKAMTTMLRRMNFNLILNHHHFSRAFGDTLPPILEESFN